MSGNRARATGRLVESGEGAEKELFNLSGIRFGLLVLVWIMGLQFLLVHLF